MGLHAGVCLWCFSSLCLRSSISVVWRDPLFDIDSDVWLELVKWHGSIWATRRACICIWGSVERTRSLETKPKPGSKDEAVCLLCDSKPKSFLTLGSFWRSSSIFVFCLIFRCSSGKNKILQGRIIKQTRKWIHCICCKLVVFKEWHFFHFLTCRDAGI